MRNFEHIDGRIVELKPLNKEGYQFDSWEVIKGDVTIKENKFTMPTEDVEVIGKYSLIPYEVIIAGENGQQSGGGIYAFNQEVLLSQSANPGYNFDGWTSDFDKLVVTNDSFVMPSRNLEITANYLLINYKVIIENDGNGNETGGGDEYHFNDEVRLTTFPKTGYDFDKWEVLEGAAIIENNKFIMPPEDVKIKATYKLAEYSVTANSGSVTSGGPFRMGDSVSLLEDQKIGYSFDGWEFDGAPIEVNQGSFVMPPRNVTVTAVYTAIEYDITVDGDNGTETASLPTATMGQTITLAASPDPGYEFTRWDSSDVTVVSGTFVMPANNVTVTAVYTAIEYDITVDGDNGTETASLPTATMGQTITLTASPDPGYEFTGWDSSDVTVVSGTFVMPANNVTVTAVYTAIEYDITVDGDNGTETASLPTATMGQTITLEASPDPGYEFTGWDSSDVTVVSGTFVMPANNVTVTAVYTAIEYDITVDGDNGTETASLPTATMGQTITLAASPDPGYEFTRWDSSDVTVVSGTFVMPANNVTVTAVYTAIEYDITVDGDNGTETASLPTATMGQTITLTASPDPGYEFTGWDSSDVTVVSGTFVMPANNVTVTAVYTAIEYDITVDGDNGTETASLPTATMGQTITLAASPDPGYEFTGWDSSDVTVVSGTFVMPANNVTVTAVYTAIEYDITVDGDNGTETASLPTATMGQTITLEADPEDGYEFSEWTTTTSGVTFVDKNNEVTTFTMPANNVTVTAVYTAIEYDITVDGDNGTETASESTATMGEEITLTASPNPGYEFDGWSVISGGATLQDPSTENATFTMPADDVVIQAAYKLKEFTVTITNDGNGSGISSGTYTVGQAVTPTSTPNAGYQFKEWEVVSPTSLTIVNDATFTMPAENVEIKAVFELKEFTVTIEKSGQTSGGTPTGGGTYTMTQSVNIEAVVAEGYEFDGWSVISGGATLQDPSTENATFTMPADDVVIQAAYKLKEFTVTITNDGNGSGISSGTYTVGQAVTPTSTPNAGYQFKEWEVVSPTSLTIVNDATFTMPAENVEIKAVFELKEFTVTIEKSGQTSGGTPTGGGTYTMTQSVNIEAVVAEGYEFDGWSVISGGATLQDPSTENATFTMPADDVVIQAAYKLKEFTVTITNDGNGSGSWSGTTTVNQTITPTSTPDAGYQFKEWEVVSPVSLNIVNNATFTMPAENVQIRAVFEEKPAYSSELGAPAARVVGTDVSLSQDGKIRAVIKANKPIVQNYNTTNNTWEDEWAPTSVTAYKVSLSADGTILAVGYSGFDDYKGKVVVYENNNGNWQQKGSQLTGEKGEWVGTNSLSVQNYQFQGDRFGDSLALSNDGLTMIVGSYSAAGSFFHRNTEYSFDRGGRVQVYQFANGNWSQLGADFTGESLYLGYGDEVRISGNGLVVAFTNYYWGNNHDENKLHVYEWASNTWVERTGVSAFNSFNQMGSPFDFSINSNGSVLSAGRYHSFGGDGSVIIYRYANSSYSSEIISAESTNDMAFGYKVDLDDSGNYCVISENYSNISDSGNEHIYVYHYSGGQWSNIGKVSGGAISSWGSTETAKVVLSGNKNVVAAIVGGKVVCFL